MHRGGLALAATLLAAPLAAQEAAEVPQPSYIQADSPYMVEHEFSPREPVNIFVEIAGVRLDTLRIDPQGVVEEGSEVSCQVTAAGSHVEGARPTVSIVMLLEDQDGRGLERVRMEPFRPGRGRSFDELQRAPVPGAALLGARKIFVMIDVK